MEVLLYILTTTCTINGMKKSTSGFTIVELLIAIIVIGILAAITTVAYNSIQRNAAEGSLRSDLAGAAKQLEVDKAFLRQYPASLAAADDGKGIKASSGNTLSYELIDGGKKYCLTATSSRQGVPSFNVSSENGAPQQGECPVAAPTIVSVTPVSNGGGTHSISVTITRSPRYTQLVYSIANNSAFAGSWMVGSPQQAITASISMGGTYNPTYVVQSAAPGGGYYTPGSVWYVRAKGVTSSGETLWSPVSTITIP